MNDSYVIGFDVGGTRLKSGAVTREGHLLAQGVQPSGFTMAPPVLLEAFKQEVSRFTATLGRPPEVIGLGFSGAVDPVRGVVFLPGKIKGLAGYPIVPELQAATGIPTIADNDGRLSIRAEAKYGKARGYQWAVTITVGTGVGSGVMLDGMILRDPHLQFGTQMSHTVMQAYGGRLCFTRARGTAEMMCSATALAMQVRDGLQRGILSLLSERYFADPHSIDFKAVIEAMEQGDLLCKDEFLHWRTNLAWLLVSTVHVYAPEIIILSGGATNAADHFLDFLREHVNAHLFRYPPDEPVPIELSEIRDHAGVLGAAALSWDHQDSMRTNSE